MQKKVRVGDVGGVRLGGSGQGGTGVCVRRIQVIEKMQKKVGREGVPIGSKVGGSGYVNQE